VTRPELALRYYGDPILRKKSALVASFGPELRTFVEDLFDCMYREKGVGLAAPQVGRLERVFVLDVEDQEGRVKRAFVNPTLRSREGQVVGEEGCLSIPGLREDVKRSATIVVEARDPSGEPFTLTAGGLLSRAIQHELDHLDGILFVDRLSPIRRKLIEARLKRFKAPVPGQSLGAEGSQPSL
jgi:peptide deformylase